jgi:hypothetical protein
MNSLEAWAAKRNITIYSMGLALDKELKTREREIHRLRLEKVKIHEEIESLKQEHGFGYFDRQLIARVGGLTQLIKKKEKELEARR